jgi:hypothetical protein
MPRRFSKFWRVVMLLLIAAVPFAEAQQPAASLRAVHCVPTADGVAIALYFDRAVVLYQYGFLLNPYRLYIDLFHTRDDRSLRQISDNPLVKEIRVETQEANVARVVVDLNGPTELVSTSRPYPAELVLKLRPKDSIPAEVAPSDNSTRPPRLGSPTSPLELKPASTSSEAPPPTTAGTPLVPFISAEASRSVTIPKITHSPKLEDFAGSSLPSDAGVLVTGFRQRRPGDGIPVSQQTSAYLSYDTKNLYVVFVCHDEPGKIRAQMSKRDDIGDDDKVTVYLDTFRDAQRAYYFSSNAFGIQADGIRTNSDSDSRFDAIWYSNGRITSDGYVVSFTIPFKSLRFHDAASQTWGIALGRSIERNDENAYWPFITTHENGFVQQFGVATGLADISPGGVLELVPYSTFTYTKLSDQETARYNLQREYSGGMDAKMVFRNSLTLDVTANPDFSQVESDDPQVTANQRYEVFFPEKRPFFLENINYFETPLNLLFTRRIVDPQAGARLTGKLGRWNIGFFAVDDQAPGQTVDPENPRYGGRAFVGAARIQREFAKDSSIGVLATDRLFYRSENRMYAVDTNIRLSPTWRFKGQTAYSDDVSYEEDDEGGTGNSLVDARGLAYFANLSHEGRHFYYEAEYQDLGPGFRAPLGFVERVDVRQASQKAEYRFRPEDSRLLEFGPSVELGMTWDHKGQVTDRYSNIDYEMNFRGRWGFSLGRNDAYENYLGHSFRHNGMSAGFNVDLKRLGFYVDFNQGTGINYGPPEGMEPFLGRTRGSSFGITWRPTKGIRLEGTYYLDTLRAPKQFLGLAGKSPGIFTNHLARTKVNFQLTKALSFRGIFDYSSFLPNSTLFDSEKSKELRGDLLLTYLVNPGTALHIGYNDGFENLSPGTDGLRRFGPPTHRTSSQVFIKLSYLIRP